MQIGKWTRQAHRWLGVFFVGTVIVATLAAATGQDTSSFLYYLPLPPLFLLMFSGLYMFAQPYASKWRSGRRAGEGA